jgi:Protein of unknown function (DUF4238)
VEVLLGRIEDGALPVLRRLASGDKFEPSTEERQALAFFIAFQELRVPGMRRMLEDGYLKLMLRVLDVAAETPGYLERLVEKYPEPKGLTAAEFRESIRDGFKGYKLSVNSSQSLGTMLHLAPTLAKWYARMRWVILRMPESEALITSDNPILKRNTNPDKSTFYGRGLGMSNRFIEVWLPVSKTTLLTISHDMEKVEEHHRLLSEGKTEEATRVRESIQPEIHYGQVPVNFAFQVKRMIAANAHQYVFSAVRDKSIADSLKGRSLAPQWD